MKWPALNALREREFRLLISARLISQLGNQITTTVMPFAILDMGRGVGDIGLVLGVEGFAVAVFLLVGGVIGDRRPRRTVMVTADLVRLVTQGGVAALLLTDHARIWHLVVLLSISGAASAFYIPAVTAIQSEAIVGDARRDANALRGLVIALTGVVGPAIGGLLVVLLNPGNALAADALSFAISATLVARMRVGRKGAAEAKRNIVTGLREGWQEFSSRRWLWSVSGLGALIRMLAIAPIMVLGPVIADKSLGGPQAWATILSSMGIGALAGGLLTMVMRPRRPLLFVVAGALLFIPVMALLSIAAPVWLLAIAAFAVGLEQAFFWTFWQTSLQNRIAPAVLSRVSSYDWLGTYAFGPLGYSLMGPLTAFVGIAGAMRGSAAVTVIAVLVVALLPDVRRYIAPAPDSAAPTERTGSTTADGDAPPVKHT